MNFDYRDLLRDKLRDKRYIHSINVSQMCLGLADKHGLDAETSEKAYTAGLLHDIMKNQSDEEQLRMVNDSGLDPDPAEVAAPKLWHAIAGAKYVRDKLGIDDPDIINAIRFHTVARADMSIVEKIVYIADKISLDRNNRKALEHRDIAFENIDLTMLSMLKTGLKKVIKKSGVIPHYTIEAYNFYVMNCTKGESNDR